MKLNSRHAEQTRTKIQVTQLINRLEGCAMGEYDLTPAQLKSIEVLLKKALPDLSAVEMSGDEDNPVSIKGIVDLVRPG